MSLETFFFVDGNKTNCLVFILRSTTLKKTTIKKSVIFSQLAKSPRCAESILRYCVNDDAKHAGVHQFFHKMSCIAMFPECVTIDTQKIYDEANSMTPSSRSIIKVPIQKHTLLDNRGSCHFLSFIRQLLLGNCWERDEQISINISDDRGMLKALEVTFH